MNGSPNKVVLNVVLGQSIPSFKNRKRIGRNKKTGQPIMFTDPKNKSRCEALESGILSALYSYNPTGDAKTATACQSQLRTLLSGLLDDSLNQIPEGTFGVEYVEKGMEGVRIEIEELP